jgi:chorismate mutase
MLRGVFLFRLAQKACAVCLFVAGGSAAVASASITPSAFTPQQVGRVDRLLQLIQQRLDLAPAIAETRWKKMSRIEDSASELALIDAVRAQSAALRLDRDLAVRFAQAQIDAGKIIQTVRHQQWATAPANAPTRQSATHAWQASTSEPELGMAMLRAFRDSLDVLRRRGARGLLDARAADLIRVGGSDLLAAQAALKPLYEIAN